MKPCGQNADKPHAVLDLGQLLFSARLSHSLAVCYVQVLDLHLMGDQLLAIFSTSMARVLTIPRISRISPTRRMTIRLCALQTPCSSRGSASLQ